MIAAMAAMSITDAVVLGRGAWTGFKHAKAAADRVQRWRRAPAALRQTFALCGVLCESLSVAEQLASRHLALQVVGSAVALARATLADCLALIGDGLNDDSAIDWKEWLEAGRKFEALQQMQMHIQMAMSSLQLAFAAVQASTLPPGYARAPFAYLPAAFDLAHGRLQEMEMGRVTSIHLADGELWQRGFQPSTGAVSDALRQLTRRDSTLRVHLLCGSKALAAAQAGKGDPAEASDEDEGEEDEDEGREEGKGESGGGEGGDHDGLYLRFASAPPSAGASWASPGGRSPGAEEADDYERVLCLDEAVKMRRLWSEELAAELRGRHGADFLEVVGPEVLCYEFKFRPSSTATPAGSSTRPLVLTFQVCTCMAYMCMMCILSCVLHVLDLYERMQRLNSVLSWHANHSSPAAAQHQGAPTSAAAAAASTMKSANTRRVNWSEEVDQVD